MNVEDEKFLDHLYKTGDNSDFTINVSGTNGNESFRVHKCVLSYRSEYFKTLLSSNFSEQKNNTLSIKEVNTNNFKIIIKSMYYGNIDLSFLKDELNKNNIYDFLEIVNLVEMYRMNYTYSLISAFLKDVKKDEDVLMESIQLFSKYNFLKISVLSIIKESLKTLIGIPEFYNFLKDKEYEKAIFEQIVLPLTRSTAKTKKLDTSDVSVIKKYLVELSKNYDPRKGREILDFVEEEGCFLNVGVIVKNFEELNIQLPEWFMKKYL